MPDCIFCKILKKEIPSKIVFESDNLYAFEDIHPLAPVHILIIPKKHISSLNDLTSEDRQKFLPEIYSTADKIAENKGFKEKGYRMVVNNQKEGGQVVYHLHFHILAGTQLKGSFGA